MFQVREKSKISWAWTDQIWAQAVAVWVQEQGFEWKHQKKPECEIKKSNHESTRIKIEQNILLKINIENQYN